MAGVSLKKDYMDGNVLYGKDLNPNFETIETAMNTTSNIVDNVRVDLSALEEATAGALDDISNLEEDVSNLNNNMTSGDSNTLESAKSYTDTKLQDYAKTTDVPTKISQLENDDNTVKDASYVHTDNNFSDTDKSKLDSLNNYELPIASTSTLGGIKLGEGLESEADGTVNVTGGGGSGENGATFTPSVDDSGNLSWTNDKGLPNPDPVNIKGPKGDTGATGEQGATGPQGPQGETGATGAAGPQGEQGDPGPAGADGITPTIGENGNWYLGETDTGKPSRGEQGLKGDTGEQGPKGDTGEQGPQGLPGPTGPGVPTGGTTGQVLSKNSDSDYDTIWKTLESSGGVLTKLAGTQDEPIDFHYLTDVGIYQVTGYVKNFPSTINTSSDTVTKTTTVFNTGNSPIIAIINSSDVRFTGYYLCEYNTNAQLLTTFSNLTEDEDGNKYVNMDYKHINLAMEANKTTLTGSPSLVTATTVRNMILTATGISNANPLSNLQTTDKSSLIAAINELNTRLAALENPTE